MFKMLIVLTSSIPHDSPTRDSPKKARAKEPSTPSKSARQRLFDAAVYVFALIS